MYVLFKTVSSCENLNKIITPHFFRVGVRMVDDTPEIAWISQYSLNESCPSNPPSFLSQVTDNSKTSETVIINDECLVISKQSLLLDLQIKFVYSEIFVSSLLYML